MAQECEYEYEHEDEDDPMTNNRPVFDAITRRSALRTAFHGAAGLTIAHALGGWLPAFAQESTGPAGGSARRAARARSVIEIWMGGGPSHLETFDPKPGAGSDYSGPLDKPIPTNVDGVFVCELLPLLAQQADKYSLVRSMTHGINSHETATYTVQTGRPSGERLVYPGFGAVIASMRGAGQGYEGLIPPHIVLTTPLGRFSESGFLSERFKPFVTGGDPNQRRFAVEGIVAEGIDDERQRARRDLLHNLDTLGGALPDDPAFRQLDQCEDKAYDLILGDAGKLFDLSQEADDLRTRYGRNTFGQSCLMARRLAERGVPYITVHSRGWDTHKQHFETMRRKLPEFDRGVATLLADLADHGLLDSTIVWCCGEFGRTPRVQWEPPWNGGRGHHGAVFSALVAGGGFKGGQVVGASDAKAMEVAERPVHPHELLGTICELLGIDPDGPMPNPRALDVTVMPPPEKGRGRGRLKELV